MGCVYQIMFENGKSYIGITCKTAEIRFMQHRYEANKGKSRNYLYEAWRKYGEPSIKTLAIVEDYDLKQTEIRAIKALNTLNPQGYNSMPGGEFSPMSIPFIAAKSAASNRGKKRSPLTEEHKAKLRITSSGQVKSEEAKNKQRAALIGRKLSDEHKAKLKASHKGMSEHKHSDETKLKISAGNRGKKLSQETKDKIGSANKGFKHSEEAKRKISEAGKRRKHSETTKSAISAARYSFYQ